MGQLISAINMFVRLKNQIEAYLWFNCMDHGSTNAKEQTRMEKANNINWHISPFAHNARHCKSMAGCRWMT